MTVRTLNEQNQQSCTPFSLTYLKILKLIAQKNTKTKIDILKNLKQELLTKNNSKKKPNLRYRQSKISTCKPF